MGIKMYVYMYEYTHTYIHPHPHTDVIYTHIVYCFMSQQHIKSYQDRYRFVAVHTHGDFIVLPHWETRPPAT